jgi:methionine-S-sulfoxide reductase
MKKLLVVLICLSLPLLSCTDNTNQAPTNEETASFAGGCFWCIESIFDKTPGVSSAVSGYIGGSEETATYSQVSAGTTDHREGIQVYFDPDQIAYEELLKIYWQQIDPTDPDGQFVDKGYHYTTAIYAHDDEQYELALASLEALMASGDYDEPIVTEVLYFEDNFYLAEEYHQDYAIKNSANYKRYEEGSGR